MVICAEGYVLSHLCGAGIAWSADDLFDPRRSGQPIRQGVLTSSTPHDQDLHGRFPVAGADLPVGRQVLLSVRRLRSGLRLAGRSGDSSRYDQRRAILGRLTMVCNAATPG
jgi:hypothetical protein